MAYWNRKKRHGVVVAAEDIVRNDGRRTRWKKARMSAGQRKVWASYTPEQRKARLESLRLAREKRIAALV